MPSRCASRFWCPGEASRTCCRQCIAGSMPRSGAAATPCTAPRRPARTPRPGTSAGSRRRRPSSRTSRCSSWLTAPSFRLINLRICRSAAAQSGAIPCAILYSMLKSQEAMRRLFDGLIDRAGNMPPLPGIYPDYSAPIIRNGRGGPRARHGALGHADAAAVPGRQAHRSGRHQHPADDARRTGGRGSGPSIAASCPSPASPRTRLLPDGSPAAGLVRLRREPAARLLRRHLGDLDLGAEGQGRAGARRPVRVSDLGAERRGRARSIPRRCR